MLPAFHHERIAASLDVDASTRPTARSSQLTPGGQLDLYAWTRRLALRIAMRALFGLDPDGARRALDRRGRPVRAGALLLLPRLHPAHAARARSPWARMQQAARELDSLIYAEISRRRATGERGEDILSLLLDAHDEDGATPHRPADPRRGHDAAVRRPRHDHLDGRLHVLRARPPPATRRAAARRAGRPARRRPARPPPS